MLPFATKHRNSRRKIEKSSKGLRKNWNAIWTGRRKKISSEITIGAACALSLTRRLGIRGIPDVLDVARALRLKVTYEDLQGCDGILIRSKEVPRGIIAVRKDIRSPGRKRFTIAHEIGHFVLANQNEGAICKSRDIESWDRDAKDKERQADDFAAELLIPATVVAPRLSTTTPSLQRIEMIADECGTSLSAAAWRYCELTSEPCAVVWSEKGTISWSK